MRRVDQQQQQQQQHQQQHRRHAVRYSEPAVFSAQHSADDEPLSPLAEEYAFERGHFRSRLFRSAARRILLRVFTGRQHVLYQRRRTPTDAENGRTVALRLAILRRRRCDSTAPSTLLSQQPRLAIETAAPVDTTDGETVPLTGRHNGVTTTDCSEAEPAAANRCAAAADGDNGRNVSDSSNHVDQRPSNFVAAVRSESIVSSPTGANAQRPSTISGLQTAGSTVSTPTFRHSGTVLVSGTARNVTLGETTTSGCARLKGTHHAGREKHCGSRERKATKTLAIVLGKEQSAVRIAASILSRVRLK
jgi:hypothetical protein